MIKKGRRQSNYRIFFNLGTQAPDQLPIGTVVAFAGDIAPIGWRMCDGSEVERSSNVFSIIGTKFGSGDGSLTTNLPDLRGRFIRGLNGTSGRDPGVVSRSSSNPGGCSGNNIGSYQVDNFGSHCHTINHSHASGSCICNDTHSHYLVNTICNATVRYVDDHPDEYIKLGVTDTSWIRYLLRGVADTPTLGCTSTSSPHTHTVNFSYTGNSSSTTDNQTAPENININFIIKV